MVTGFATFTLAVEGLFLGIIHMIRQKELKRKSELVLVRINNGSSKI